MGWRGSRVGEASHPGPRSDVPDEILDDLELMLVRIDSVSEDEPIMRRGDGRNVVPRRATGRLDSANLHRSRIQWQGACGAWASEASQGVLIQPACPGARQVRTVVQ